MVLAESREISSANDERRNTFSFKSPTQRLSKYASYPLFSFSLSPHKFVKIVYSRLFHLSAVMAEINRPLNTGSCESPILGLVASGIIVFILI